ncbi:MAG: TonB-linked SusC/RagA family outer membrane protein [Polaribacter sp.]|jgi:TonB-linked SusC/RagA family outer membrane protein
MKKNLTSLFTFLCLFSIGLTAQSTLTGKITDAKTGEDLIGATILVVGTDKGTATDIDGTFTIKDVTLPATLQFTYTGYKTLEVPVENALPLEIKMGEDSEILDEIVVIGYGKQEKRVSTGAISRISAESIEGFAVSDVSQALEGQVTGLLVNEASGQPGASKTILIRGISTNGDNSPLFIVDGLQVGNIDNIAPGDVESVDVLKDAASCAIYGARAANGVVIITTKKGKNEKGGTITYEGFFSRSTAWRKPEMLGADEYINITREKFENSGQLGALETLGFPTTAAGSPNTNWMDEIFSPANVISHRLSATVKNAYISMEYWDQNGIIGGEKSNYNRYAVRFNSTKEINEYITIGQNAYANRVDNQNIGVNNSFGGVLADAFAYDPITGTGQLDQSNSNTYGFTQSDWVQKEYINPLSRLFLAQGAGNADALLGNVYLDIKPTKNITFRSDFGYDVYWFQFRNFTPDYNFHASAINPVNQVAQGYGSGQAFQWENYLNYNNTFLEKHNFDLVLGTSYRTTNFTDAGGSSQSIPDAVKFNSNWQYLNSGEDSTDLSYGNTAVDYALISYFGRVQYDYDKKYLFTATVRRDGSSNFGDNNRWGIFPSFSAGWVPTKEPFFNYKPISYLKFKASWGINGSDRISPLAYASTIENVFTYSFGNDQSLQTGAALATPPNPNVRWEESEQIDLGMEMELFDGVWTIEADVYRKTTKDLLMAEVIPGYIGATNNPISNLGEIRNQGIEIGIGHRMRSGDFTITNRLSYTRFKNKVINVAGDAGFLPGWSWPVRNTPITRMTEGYEVGHFVGYETNGIFQNEADIARHFNADGEPLQPNAQPGDLIFVDTNGDGEINSDDIADIGSPWPDHILGFTTSMSWKGFDFSAVLSAQIGHQIFRAYERSDITYTNYQTFWLDRWTPDNTDGKYPRLVSNDVNNNQRPSDFYLEDGSFLRLRNIQLGYNIPTDLLAKVKVKELRIYFTANNLLTLTNYEGFDPDIGTNGWILDSGIDKGAYPSNKTVGGGVKITF